MRPEELEAFYEKHRDPVWSFLHSLSRSPEEADDLLHNTFLKFISLVEQGRVRRDQARSLLFTMARRKFLDQYRRRKRYRRVLEVVGRDTREEVDYDFQHGVIETIRDTLENPEIPERARIILEMRIFEQLSVEMICERLGLSKSAVYESLEKSMKYLRKALLAAGFAPDR